MAMVTEGTRGHDHGDLCSIQAPLLFHNIIHTLNCITANIYQIIFQPLKICLKITFYSDQIKIPIELHYTKLSQES